MREIREFFPILRVRDAFDQAVLTLQCGQSTQSTIVRSLVSNRIMALR